ncbi:MAG: hypothetical protein WCJ95_20250, partial [Mariniphaga sp.]
MPTPKYVAGEKCFSEIQKSYNALLAFQLVAKVANVTTVTELTGIRMAATTGESCPDNAYD